MVIWVLFKRNARSTINPEGQLFRHLQNAATLWEMLMCPACADLLTIFSHTSAGEKLSIPSGSVEKMFLPEPPAEVSLFFKNASVIRVLVKEFKKNIFHLFIFSYIYIYDFYNKYFLFQVTVLPLLLLRCERQHWRRMHTTSLTSGSINN